MYEYSQSHNSVPVDRKKLNKTVKNNFFVFFKKHMFTYISHTYTQIFLVVGGISISSNDLLDPIQYGLHQFLQILRIVHPENP
jgi:hypothetical protein